MELGSPAHKERFCRQFLESHLDYEPEKLPWPDLQGEDLARLRGIPFWREALLTEQEAGVMVTAFAETLDDPLIRQAVALQGQEESRHARLVDFLIRRYGVEISEYPYPEVPANIRDAFIDFGFAECLDSFFAFGMFGIARQAQYLPESMFQIFDPILDEEARHIVFFINWITYCQCQSGYATPWRGTLALWRYGRALRKLLDAFGNPENEAGQPFTASQAGHFMDDLTPELFFDLTLQENEKRMARFDPELLQPLLLPRLSRLALGALRLRPRSLSPAAG
ncbi:MAG: ferritin-like domain-containing protein [Cyanobacteriota bacterium]|nr:ferritin-like domain-containing protein [Cyanobacteriota bacterium]